MQFPLMLSIVILFSAIAGCSGISCYSCNSHYDKRCGDPFSNYTTQLVNCDQEGHKMTHLPKQEDGTSYTANICRKTTQIVGEDTRVIRGCGWLPNPENMKDRDCFTRTGTHQVMVHHCVCTGDACNSAIISSLSLISFAASLLSLSWVL